MLVTFNAVYILELSLYSRLKENFISTKEKESIYRTAELQVLVMEKQVQQYETQSVRAAQRSPVSPSSGPLYCANEESKEQHMS